MIPLGCVLGRMGNFAIPQFLNNGAPAIRACFWNQSGQDIDLQIDSSHLNRAIKPGTQDYAALDLHQAAQLLTHNPPAPARSERIAVLFANSYAPNYGVLGMMFDRGFATWDDPNTAPVYVASPREGCAIFLQAIVNLRGMGFAMEQEAFFTTIHEMGHLFNLQHSPPATPSNFMATSQVSDAYQPPCQFSLHDQQQLHQCSSSPYVYPGGAIFQNAGAWTQSAEMPRREPAIASGLELRLSLSRFEFWQFEPVELEIELRVANGLERNFLVPDTLDPGYADFIIWLESPDRGRRRYRSPRHYCSAPSRRRVTPKNPIRRDISIFGEAGGYTFRQSGPWRIWAEFAAGTGRRLRSNVLELGIKPFHDSDDYREAAARLTDVRSAGLLYHRLLRPQTNAVALLELQLAQNGSLVPPGGLEYALGRALLAPHSEVQDSGQAKAGLEYLRRARDRDDIGDVQRLHADRLLRKRSETKRRRKPVIAELPQTEWLETNPESDFWPVPSHV